MQKYYYYNIWIILPLKKFKQNKRYEELEKKKEMKRHHVKLPHLLKRFSL